MVEEARQYCAGVLGELGFTVTERAFDYSQFPGKFGTPLGGLWVATVATVAARESSGGRAGRAVAILILGFMIAALVGRYLAVRGVLAVPLLRARGVNLEAVRGQPAPMVWLVAHVDSKWQPIPMAARAGGIVLLALAAIAALVVSIVQWRTGVGSDAWLYVHVATWTGALPVMFSFVGTGGAGAVDNASGVAAVLDAAGLLASDASVGVLITDAEELGLAGAHAWARDRAAGVALNCDGVDDEGMLTVMYSGRVPSRVIEALRDAAAKESAPLRIMRVIPGVLTDSVALAAAGWETATLSRGSLRTLRRIHTTSDTLDALRGTGIASVSRALARAATQLR